MIANESEPIEAIPEENPPQTKKSLQTGLVLDFEPNFRTLRARKTTVRLEWSNMQYSVGKKEILKGISGEASPGEGMIIQAILIRDAWDLYWFCILVVAIMGPRYFKKKKIFWYTFWGDIDECITKNKVVPGKHLASLKNLV